MSSTRTIILLLCLFVIFACADKKIVPEPVPSEPSLMEQAADYWDKKNYSASQSLYRKLTRQPDITQKQEIIIWQRLAVSAFKNEDYKSALEALEKWAELDRRAKQSWKWHEMFSVSLKKTVGENFYIRYLSDLLQDLQAPYDLRKNAALALAGFHFEERRYPESMSILENFYARTDSTARQKELERDYRTYLEQFTPDQLMSARAFLDQEKIHYFPWNVFLWSLYSRQLENDPSSWESLGPLLETLSRQGEFADQEPYARQFKIWLEEFGRPVREIAMLLPLSGQFSSSAWKILDGAAVAHWEILQGESRIMIRIINTHQEGWLEELRAMDSVSIVGGPLSRGTWEKITGSGLNKEKVFFTFLPSIDDEGSRGWRFFTSPEDQVRIMIDKAVFDLGFTDFAVFYPEDDFGRTYAQVFWKEAVKKGARISGLQSYPRDEPERWNNIVASFLDIKDKDKDHKNITPGFQAVFIPDSLSTVKGLLPQFFYFDQNQLVFMGPMLWSQAFSPDTLEQQYFSLSMTTGAWLNEDSSPAAAALQAGMNKTVQGKPDLWTALGYDFIRFVNKLKNLPAPEQNEEINKQLAGNNFQDWSMAPVSWDNQGRASQDLYVLQLNKDKLSRADMSYYNSLIQIRKARKNQWLEILRKKEKDTHTAN
ncbi:MAG: penicillin-binding protein activator [Desulfonatronovibrio sp.]